MGNIFAGLESLGIGKVTGINIYEEEKQEATKKESAEPAVHVVTEEELIFDKKMTCPVCDTEFKVKTVKSGKPKFIGADSDLRPRYVGIDSVKYDAIVCPCCGYAALGRFFSYMTSAQAKLIKDTISIGFRGFPESGAVYTYEEAINRHKLALYNAVVKKAKNSERAYTCLKLAWLFRGMRETLPAETENFEAVKKECADNELEMIGSAFEGFMVSRAKEDFPICGMDQWTFDYLLADLAARLGKYEIASKLATSIIVSRAAKTQLKERARSLRDEIKDKIKS